MSTYSFPLRSRLNNRPEDPDAAADAAENDANEPDDNALRPGVPAFVVPCPDELCSRFIPKLDLLDDGILC